MTILEIVHYAPIIGLSFVGAVFTIVILFPQAGTELPLCSGCENLLCAKAGRCLSPKPKEAQFRRGGIAAVMVFLLSFTGFLMILSAITPY